MTDSMLPNLEDVLCNPTSSRWLRLSIKSALERDAVDVASDARLLAQLLEQRADRIRAKAGETGGRGGSAVVVLPMRAGAPRAASVDLLLPLDDHEPLPGTPRDGRPGVRQGGFRAD